MGKGNFYTICFLLLCSVEVLAQNSIRLINTDNLLTKKEKLALENAIRYESDFFSRLFPEKTINISEIKFVVAASYFEFVNYQVERSDMVHVNAAGFFSPSDSALVVLKDKKTQPNIFLSTCYHELSHAFLSLYAGTKFIPPWFNEGLAEYLEQMTYEKKKAVQRINKYNVKRVKTLIELKDLKLSEFIYWDYQKFSAESFTQDAYGYAVGYCMLLFLMQNDQNNALTIFRNLIGEHSTVEVFDQYYVGGFAQFEKEFMEYFEKY